MTHSFSSVLTILIVITIIVCGLEHVYGCFSNYGIDLFWPYTLYKNWRHQYESIPNDDQDYDLNNVDDDSSKSVNVNVNK